MPTPPAKRQTRLKVMPAMQVCRSDLQNLRESGLSDATIRENKLRTENQSLVFPYHDLKGKTNGFARKRPHKPRTKNGKQVKYEQPKGKPLRAYFPKRSLKFIRDGKSDIYFTEGEKKALALSQLGVAAIGLGGVWCACKKGTDDLIPDLAEITWDDRTVFVVFDFDEKEKTRTQVELASRRLAKVLKAAGANVVNNVNLPPGSNGGKQGVDDFLRVNDEADFRQLVEAAEPITIDSSGTPSMTVAAGRTDSANATRLITKFRDQIRWVGPWDKWLIWDGKRWAIDQTLRIHAFAKQTVDDLWAMIRKSAGRIGSDEIKGMVRFAVSSANANGIRNMVSLARSEPGNPIDVDALDTHPWLLNVLNGTIDLRTGTINKHNQGDFLTQLAPVTFSPDATCPLWLRFLDKIFAGNAELIAYQQRLCGYVLTGTTGEHILPFFYGVGRNGKSTLVEVFLFLLGSDYAMKAGQELLLTSRGNTHPTELADLFRKRLVACIETKDGRRLNESLVKELTGGDRIRARRMREDFWEFRATHKIWIAGNYKPEIRGTDEGIWARVKLLPFDVIIPESERDTELKEKLETETSGILNWAIEGCLDWQSKGMQEPEIVRMATKNYSVEMDVVGEFIGDYCELGEFMAPASELFKSFQSEMPSSDMTQRSFGTSLRRRGFEKCRITKGVNKAKHGWKGLRLRSDAEAEQIQALIDSQRRRKRLPK